MQPPTRRRLSTAFASGAATLLVATFALTPTAEAAPRIVAPTGLQAVRLTGTSVALTWNAVSGASAYDVLRDGAVVVADDNIPTTFMGGLKPATSYKFTIRSKSGGSVSADSAPLTVTTKSDPGGSGGRTIYGGARSSSYGISPFPNPCGFGKAITSVNSAYPGSTPTSIWIVGNISNNGIGLQFPKPAGSGSYPNITFASSDKHEAYLDYFDANNIKVWLQVESGFADMETLIDLILKRYGHHPSVLGFAVDVEWFNPRGADLNDPVTDALGKRWEDRVKSYNPKYQLVLKHFNPASLPATYRGDIVFVDDSQQFPSLEAYLAEFKGWADVFYPAKVGYQVGYATDQAWWTKLAKPVPATLGKALAGVTRQDFGMLWVDFTLRTVAPTTC